VKWRVYDEEKPSVKDVRHGMDSIRHNRRSYVMPRYDILPAWENRAQFLKRQIRLAAGLWPVLEAPPLNARLSDKLEREGYSVEKVYFESLPGLYVTGNLYRPLTGSAPFPALACPHGHWTKGRLENSEKGSVPGRCIQLARMGFVVFSYDMIGYNDSRLQIQHHFGGQREALWGLSAMGLQLRNSLRVMDFLEALPDVDSERMGCTGASGGGTQTFLLAAVDPRVKAAAPVNMISSHFQGGCLCENGPLLRLGTFNVEIGALMAPRPLLLVSCTGDWTSNTLKVEYPAVRSVYRLYEAEDQVKAVQVEADHNYNQESRESVYAFFAHALQDASRDRRIKEKPFQVENDEALRVFADKTLPSDHATSEEMTQAYIDSCDKLIERLLPTDESSLAAFRDRFEDPFSHVVLGGTEIRKVEAVELGTVGEGEGTARRCLLLGSSGDLAIPCFHVPPRNAVPARGSVLFIHGQGKSAFLSREENGLGVLAMKCSKEGFHLLLMDAFDQGEAALPDPVEQKREETDYFDTYNLTDASERVRDCLNGMAFLQKQCPDHPVHLIGGKGAGPIALLARALSSIPGRTVVDCSTWPVKDEDFVDGLYIPCFRRVGGIRTAFALTAPRDLFLVGGSPPQASWLGQLYKGLNAEESLQIDKRDPTPKRLVHFCCGKGRSLPADTP